MGRMIDLDEELGFEEYKPSIKFYGKKWFVNAGPDTILRVKVLDKKIKEAMKNASKSKNKEEAMGEVFLNNYRETFKILFGNEQANEIFELGLTIEQIELINRAVAAIMSNKDFNPNVSEVEEEEKKTN